MTQCHIFKQDYFLKSHEKFTTVGNAITEVETKLHPDGLTFDYKVDDIDSEDNIEDKSFKA